MVETHCDKTDIIDLQSEAKGIELGSTPCSPLPGFVARTTLNRWIPILAKFAFIQAVVQVMGLAAGLIIVRSLTKREYAFYTIGNTMLSAILILADSGISSALTAIGGRVWQDSRRLGSLFNTALQLRRPLAVLTLLGVVPLLIFLLVQNGASRFATMTIVLAVLIGSGLELITRIYSVALRLKSEIRQIQNQAILAAAAKLALVSAALLVFMNAAVAISSVVVGYGVQFLMLRRWVHREVDRSAPTDPAMRSEIVSVLKKQAPHSIYYCVQGQITVWLISLFGNAENVANVGALGRFAVVFALLSSVTAELVLPAFARIQFPHQLRWRYLQIITGYVGVSLLSVAAVAAFPRQILSVLGHQYSGLYTEGILMAGSAVVSTTAGLLWGLNCSRAWILPPALLIPVTIAFQVALIAFLDLSTVKGVLLFTTYSYVPSIVLSVWLAMKQMRSSTTFC